MWLLSHIFSVLPYYQARQEWLTKTFLSSFLNSTSINLHNPKHRNQPSTTTQYATYPTDPASTSDLGGELEELIHIKTAIGIYDRSMLAIINSTTTPAQLNLHRGFWLQAKSKVATLHRSIVADFNRLPRHMKRSFVSVNRLALNDHGFRPSADNLEITRPGSRRVVVLLLKWE
ncbi:hypothetical protein N7463_003704 [Penicillium fimorum]|uniref:Uncharacterized protein n=1 Tax=Penicillium fimorum TaxID=1882269 RepID=A0A9W9Y1K2_9EURO|nr:hypothetical protein N7463_003704 [Penicillium fimorum]